MAYASLQKFTGANPRNILGGWENGEELDEAWNPRNKALADAKFYADVKKNGFELSAIGWRILVCWVNLEFVAGYFFTGVGHLGDRDWPVTKEDIKDIGDAKEDLDPDWPHYRFLPCYGLVPSTANVSVTQTSGGFIVNWTNDLGGCVPDITINKIEACVTSFVKVLRRTGCKTQTGTPTSAVVDLDFIWNRLHADSAAVELRLYPDRREYGKKYYRNDHRIPDIKRN